MKNTFSLYATLSLEEVEKQLQTSFAQGLSSAEVKKRQDFYGLNMLHEKHAAWWKILLHQFYSLFVITFLVIFILSLLLYEFKNALVIGVCLVVTIVTGFYQEYRAHKDLQHLKNYLISFVRVIRDGAEARVPSNQLVPGDIIILVAGTILPADIRCIVLEECSINEAALTGESMPVRKTSNKISMAEKELSLFDVQNIGFAGTTVVAGGGKGVVLATGKNTEFGLLTGQEEKPLQTHLVKSINTLTLFIIILIFGTIIASLCIQLLFKGTAQVYALFIFAITLAVSSLPEALPMVITFGLARGARKLAQKNVIVKRLSAIEDLGSIEILCSDKTGTLTENILQVKDVYGALTLLYALLAVEVPYEQLTKSLKGIDNALWDFVASEQKDILKQYSKIKEVPFDSMLLRNSVIVQKQREQHYELIVRGALDEVITLCVLDDDQRAQVIDYNARMSAQGYRIIAVAKKTISKEELTTVLSNQGKDFEFIGCISFFDPIKKTTYEAIKIAQSIGVTIKILSGDSKEVCGSVAHQLGIITHLNDVIVGADFIKKSKKEKEEIVQNNTVFARVTPDQKYEIIQILQEYGIVGYLGDGANDVPALKAAHVALVVQEAVDIARDAADIILLKKSLYSIVQGIFEGRRSVVNTLKYIKTTLASNLGNFYSLVIASFVLPYFPMLPTQLLFVNLLCDFPMIAISTDTVSKDLICKPSNYNFKEIIFFCGIFAPISTLFDFIYFSYFKKCDPSILQSGWFIVSVLTGIVFLFSVRSTSFFCKASTPSFVLIVLSCITSIGACLLPNTFWGHQFLHFSSLEMHHRVIIVFIVFGYFCTTELIKSFYYSIFNVKNSKK